MANVYLCVPVNFPWIATRKSWQMSRCCIGVFPHSSFNPENLLYSSISLRGESILNVFFFLHRSRVSLSCFLFRYYKKNTNGNPVRIKRNVSAPPGCIYMLSSVQVALSCVLPIYYFFLTMLNIKHMYHGIHSRRT